MPTAVITGGARRIGRAIAEHLHDRGFDIALHYRSSEADARELAASLSGRGIGACRLYQADLESDAEVASLGAAILADTPTVDLLVNNASGFEPTPLETCSPAQFDRMLAGNLRGPYFLTQALLPGLRAAAAAAVVNIVDIHVQRPLPQFNAYVAAKAGLASLTRSLAVELAPVIRVNGVAPGAILWPDGDEGYDAATREHMLATIPMRRLGEPEDIARTVAFLACDAPYITGQVVAVDGGGGLV